MSKIEESGKKIFSLKVSKNYISQVNGHIFGQKCHQWGQFGQNRSFSVKMAKIASLWRVKMTSYVKIWRKWSKNFSLIVYINYFSQFYGHKFGQNSH